MNKLNDLINKQDFKTIINDYKDSKNIEEMFAYALALGIEGETKKADEYFKNNFVILSNQPVRLITSHIGIFLYTNDFLMAEKILQYYEDKPYISQEVEETFIEQKQLIEKKKQESYKTKGYSSIEQIKEDLNSNDDIKIQKAIMGMQDYRIDPFITFIEKILINSSLKITTRTLALIILYIQKYDKEVPFYYFVKKEIIKIKPSEISYKDYEKLANRFNNKLNDVKNVSVVDAFISCLRVLDMMFFPFDNPYSDDVIYLGLLKNCYALYQLDTSEIDKQIHNQNISEKEINDLINILNEGASNFTYQ